MRLKDKFKKIIYILKGCSTYLPQFLSRFLPQHQFQAQGKGIRKNQSIEDLAISSYGAWLRFLVLINKYDTSNSFETIGEIGPGDSFGLGLCALLSGSNSYYAFDVVQSSFNVDNLKLFDVLVGMFKNKTPIPNEIELPKSRPKLINYDFPSHILTDEILEKNLNPERLEIIRQEIVRVQTGQIKNITLPINLEYIAPYEDILFKLDNKFDLIVSGAVMEHVDDVNKTYQLIYKWLKPNGLMSHSVDLKSHGTSSLWNGHLTYSDFIWRLIKGKSVYLINRYTHSGHLKSILDSKFQILLDDIYTKQNTLSLKDLNNGYKDINLKELEISEFFIIAKKIN